MKIVTDERCTGYSSVGHPERPARISKTVEKLKEQTALPIEWEKPAEVSDEVILRAHTAEHLSRVKAAASHFDGDTPAHPGIFEHALRSVGGAVQAMQFARKGQRAFSLLRPPGHHATREQAMGFCYFNSVAIALLQALATGASKVAIYDFDVHHGNGTEAILVSEPHTLFCSIHQHPCYPGTGTSNVGQNCYNYPLAPKTARAGYRQTLTKALGELAAHKPDLLGISAGFDAYARDPLAQETLEAEDFHWIGESIRKLGIPCFAVLEGGYSKDLPELILSFLKGWDGK
ncbi:MAG TPA: histone deacetylase [Verrucomicrobiae bacterium]|jgi:acetoin utilization deacetylase AcuC-like enzyme